jgi:cytidine deaminase
MTDNELILEARRVLEHAYAPYSSFPVGAALLARDGRVFTGVNVENSSIGLSVCAERNAIAKAISQGVREFEAMAVVTKADTLTMPCGVCRQVIWEFSHDLKVLIESADGTRLATTIADLFPMPFTSYEAHSVP